MTPAEAESLGRRWLAAGGGWRAGMIDGYGDRVIHIRGSFATIAKIEREGHDHVICKVDDLWWPDLRDPATLGVCLAVVRERLNEPTAHLRPDIIGGHTRWGVERADGAMLGADGTWGHALISLDEDGEAEALVNAMECAP